MVGSPRGVKSGAIRALLFCRLQLTNTHGFGRKGPRRSKPKEEEEKEEKQGGRGLRIDAKLQKLPRICCFGGREGSGATCVVPRYKLFSDTRHCC